MKIHLIAPAVLLLFSLVACETPQKIDPQAEALNLMEASRAWARVAREGNVDQILSYWDENAVLMMPGMADLKGREQLRQMVEGSSGMPGFEIDWEPKEARVSASGDLGFVVAHKYFKVNDSLGNPIITHFREVTLWEKKPDGSWKNIIDIYNVDPSITSIK